MKIIVISDTHGKHKALDNALKNIDGDILIHCGDFTNLGYEHEIQSFINWFTKLDNFKHKFVIAGNHEITLDFEFYDNNWSRFHKKKQDCHKLVDWMTKNKHFTYEW